MDTNVVVLKPLYDVKMIEKNNSHYYDVTDGKGNTNRFPGVTGFLNVINKPALINWAKNEALQVIKDKMLNYLGEQENLLVDEDWIERIIQEAKMKPDKIKDDAADIGKQVHAFIDLIINGKEPETVPETLESAINAFKQWWSESDMEIVMGDTKVASVGFKYGGSLDCLGRRNNEYVILDWKTGGGIYIESALQVSAYAHAFEETYGILCAEAIVVRFSKKEPIEFEYREVNDIKESFNTFVTTMELSQALKLNQWK